MVSAGQLYGIYLEGRGRSMIRIIRNDNCHQYRSNIPWNMTWPTVWKKTPDSSNKRKWYKTIQMIILKRKRAKLTSRRIGVLSTAEVLSITWVIIHRVSVAVEGPMLFAPSAKAPEGSDTPCTTWSFTTCIFHTALKTKWHTPLHTSTSGLLRWQPGLVTVTTGC